MWEEVYTSACADLGVKPRGEILAAAATSAVQLSGNTFENFNNRVTDDEVAALAEACARLPLVGKLQLAYNRVSMRGASSLANAMQHGFSSLQYLDLSYNSCDAEAANALAAAATTHPMLSTLLLSGNPLGSGVGDSVRQMLETSTALVTLDMENADLDMRSLVQISRGLMHNTTLTTLNLGRQLISNPDDVAYVVQHLALALKENRTLENLCLSHLNITDRDLVLLLSTLHESAVVSLSLKGNKLSQDSGAALAMLLRQRSDFCMLDLTANRLRDVGAVSLALAVAAHPGLRALHLCSNTIGGTGICAIANALKTNASLASLRLWGNDFSDKSLADLYACRERLESMEDVDFSFYVVDGRPMLAHE